MAGVAGEIEVRIEMQQTGSADLGSPAMTLDPIRELLQFTAGTTAVNKLDVMFSDTRTLAASGTEDLDVAGVLSSAFGATITAAEVVAIFVKAHAGNTNNVNITRPSSNGLPFLLAAGDGQGVKPGEFALFASETGWAVTAGTGDLITITNSAGTTGVTYDIVILGRTVAA